MNLFGIITILIALSALFGYLNVRFLKLPQTIGLMVLALFFSLAMQGLNSLFPTLFHYAENVVNAVDFSEVLLQVMLCFLLFAGALHTDSSLMKSQSKPILLLAMVSVVLSTIIIAGIMRGISIMIHHPINFIHCLLFGALISPTDPIAVLGILSKSKVPKKIEINIVGESLFNDGVGVVIFATILQVIHTGTENISVGNIILLFVREAFGGLAFGLLLGFVMFRLLKSIDHYETEVMITLAMVMAGYQLASYLEISGPLAMVASGLFISSREKGAAMSDTTKQYIDKFWELIDVLMNAILFVLIGLRLMVLDYKSSFLIMGLLAIPIVLLSRWLSIRIPLLISKKWIPIDRKSQALMAWGGLRGGLSIAMALSLPREQPRDLLVFMTYVIVVFSIVIQGLTVGPLAKRLFGK